jgi:hypothetical protein
MIIIKNSQLSQDTVTALNAIIDLDIKAGEAFKLMRILKDLSSIIEDKTKLEKKIFEKYVERDSAGNPVEALDNEGKVIPNAVKITDTISFNKEMEELMEVNNTLNHDKLNFEDLNLNSNVKVKDLLKIDFLFN